ncbi:MAG: hypothetical protein JSS79_14705 [Bacteroidetes bacterium]|nr:hypothetical protein [Bacteroidota bacterium]
MKKLILLFIVLFTATQSFGQKNFQKGYIIQLNGDTIRGAIDYANWEKNPKKINFKNSNGTVTEFSPIDIKEFKVLDERYLGAIVEAVNPFNLTEYQASPQLKMDTAFLQTMIDGPKQLFYYQSPFGQEHFYIRQDSKFVLLVFKKYIKMQNGFPTEFENNKYVGQLTYYLDNCPSLKSKLNNLDYVKTRLEALFNTYYENCTSSQIKFQKKTEKIKTQIGVLGGLALTSLVFKTDNQASASFNYIDKADFKQSVGITGGVFVEFILPRSKQKWSINNEITYSSYNASGFYNDYMNSHQYTKIYSTLNYAYLKLGNMLRYKFLLNKGCVFINFGITNGAAISEKNSQHQETTFFTTYTTSDGNALGRTRRYEVGFLGGIGTKFNKLSFETRYESGNGMSDYTNLAATTNKLYFLIGYNF